jgi:beta-glucosidase
MLVHNNDVFVTEHKAVGASNSSSIYVDGEGKINEEGVAYYDNLIDYLLHKGSYVSTTLFQILWNFNGNLDTLISEQFHDNEAGITPYVNLHHYDLPLALEKKYRGWLNAKTL